MPYKYYDVDRDTSEFSMTRLWYGGKVSAWKIYHNVNTNMDRNVIDSFQRETKSIKTAIAHDFQHYPKHVYQAFKSFATTSKKTQL